ncbi:MAG: hypothetical protein AB1451_07865 [Nitrospirota bacterium]
MSNRNVRGLYTLAVAAVWIIATAAIVGASTMPPPDQPEETAAAVPPSESVAPPATPPDAAAESEGQDGPAAEELQAAPEPSELRSPIDGIRPHTDVVGEVVGHPTGKVLLAVHDLVTLKFDRSQDVKPHDRYAIARREQFVEHPDSGRNMGYVVRVVATVEMKQAFGRYWSAEIVSSNDYVTLDDWVIPFESVAIPTGEEAADLAGHIVAVRDELLLAGEATVVYTDLGSAQGVKPGEEFAVIRPGIGGRRGAPDRPVGVLRILAVQEESSSAYLTKTTEPVMVGDRLQHAMVSSAVQ